MDDVAAGAQRQAKEADVSNHMMTGFAEKVDGICAGTDDMGNTIDKATTPVEQGVNWTEKRKRPYPLQKP